MADPGSKLADDSVKEIEKELKSIYNRAYRDVLQKQKDFNSAYARKEAKHQADLAAGKITQEQFDAWKRGQVFQGDQWQAKKKQMLDTVHNANTIATDIINSKMSGVFAGNANYMAYTLEKGVGVNFGFGLYDSATVVNLIKNDPKLLPEWKIDQPKDYTWNEKKLNRQITLGIVEGESLDTIAKRLSNSLATQNFNKMRTFARTAMTGAQNSGREYKLQEALGLDINVKKEWMCTLDAHTRALHRLLDGQKQNVDKPFEAGGLKIRYPGDPEADPSLVYNCRCTMVGDVEDYPSTYNRYDNINGHPIENMTYDEWERQNRKLAEEAENAVRMLDESEAADLISLFSGRKMSNLYNEMRELDTKTATAFYNELKSLGKPSEIWQQYLDGTLPPSIDTSRLNGILQSYAEKKGLIVPKKDVPIPPAGSTLKEIFGGKKMSNVFNEIKSVDKTIANQFYKELGKMGKPSEIWQQYLDGKLTDDQKKIIEDILTKYTDKAGIKLKPKVEIFNPKEIFGDKKMSNVFNELKGIDSKAANEFYKELKKLGKPSEVWEQYLNGTLKSDKLDELLKPHFGKKTPEIPIVPKTKAKATPKVKPISSINQIKNDFKNTGFYDILDKIDKVDPDFKISNDLWQELRDIAKSQGTNYTQIWEKYLSGNLSKIESARLDEILAKYAKKAGISIGDKIKEIKRPDRTWVEKSIEKDKFKKSAKNAEDARNKVIDEIMKTPENYRRCFTDTLKKIKFFDENGKAFYRDYEKRISINFDKIQQRDKSLGTFFHENGHAMDYAYMYLKNSGKEWWEMSEKDRTSQLPGFLSAIDKDLKNLSKNIDSLGYNKDMWDNGSKGVQDFISALKPLNDKGPRKGKIPDNLLSLRYNWHHDYTYYTRKSDPMVDAASELFANISGGYGDPKQMKYMQKYFPNAVKEFENIIDEMAKMIKL